METINDRIQYIVDHYYNENASALCEASGLKQGSLKDTLGKRKTSPGYDTIVKILRVESLNLSSEWLLLGEGNINKNDILFTENHIDTTVPPAFNALPFSKQNNIEQLTQEIKRLKNEIALLKNTTENVLIEQLMENHRIQYDKLRFENTSLQKQVAILQERYHNEEARRDKEKNSRSG